MPAEKLTIAGTEYTRTEAVKHFRAMLRRYLLNQPLAPVTPPHLAMKRRRKLLARLTNYASTHLLLPTLLLVLPACSQSAWTTAPPESYAAPARQTPSLYDALHPTDAEERAQARKRFGLQ